MIKHKIFLRWWLFFVLILAVFSHAFFFGIIGEIWASDFTKLSFLNLFLLLSTSMWCGYQTWLLSSAVNKVRAPGSMIKRINHNIEVGWFVSDLVLTIGMTGTVIGFIAMLGGFVELNIENVSTIQDLITELGTGMSTALYTTLTGLVSSALLKIQCFNLSNTIDKYLK